MVTAERDRGANPGQTAGQARVDLHLQVGALPAGESGFQW